MAKNTVSASPFGKWDWLRRMARRAELLALVAGDKAPITARGVEPAGSLTPADLDGFGLTTAQARLVCWDSLGVRARLAGQSYRKIEELVTPVRSHETWRNVVRLYLEFSDELFAKPVGLKLGRLARNAITADVLRSWSRGTTTTGDVVELLGGGAVRPAHALYWLRRRAGHLGLSHLPGLSSDAG